MPRRVALHTLGCKLNFSETSAIGSQFLTHGFDIVDIRQKADVYIFNTCTVTENAEKECRQLVRRVLRNNPEGFVIVTGCYAQLRPEEISNINGVDAILGSNEKFRLFEIIKNFEKNNLTCIYKDSVETSEFFGEAHSTDADSRTRAYFKIQDGCDYKCSFCTIPLARGKSRSMNFNSALLEFNNLIHRGYKEIILTGVNVGDYGKAIGSNLYDLLSQLTKVEGEFRIRISSIEPNLLTEEIIDLIGENEKICNHLHIPLQSGSSAILKAMQRRYSVQEYESVVLKTIERIKDVGIGVDVIVGFPGETEKSFIETYNFLRDLPISYLHVFSYSERPDTSAITLENQVDFQERKRRNKILRILSEKKRREFNQSKLGTIQKVLFEDSFNDGKMKGFSSNYIRSTAKYDEDKVNRLVDFNLTAIDKEGLCTGKITDTKKSIELISV